MVESVAHLSIVLAETYALGEVSEVEKRRVEKHVASCQRCADLLGEQQVWVAQMRSPFRRKVEKMIEEERKKRTGKK
jgi:anti-sigma factor RsiW